MLKSYKIAASAALALAACSATPALAASSITCDSPSDANNCGFFHSFGTSPGSLGEVSPGIGIDQFSFTIASLKTITGSLVNFYTNLSQDVNFGSGNLAPSISGGSLAAPVFWATTATGNPDMRSLGPLLLGAGTYTVSVNYNSAPNGFYFGTLDLVSAIPEPASWALMILGFGMVGGVLRARKGGQAVLSTR